MLTKKKKAPLLPSLLGPCVLVGNPNGFDMPSSVYSHATGTENTKKGALLKLKRITILCFFLLLSFRFSLAK